MLFIIYSIQVSLFSEVVVVVKEVFLHHKMLYFFL